MSLFIDIFLSIALVFVPAQAAPVDTVIELSTISGCAGMSVCE